MKPVTQTITGEKGNCFPACLASLFEIPIQEIPNFIEAGPDAEDFWSAARAWLRERGWGILPINLGTGFGPECLHGYQMVWGTSPRGRTHATIWKDGVMVHDPHPDQSGLSTVEGADLLYPLDAGAMMLRAKAVME